MRLRIGGILGEVDQTMPGTWVGHTVVAVALYLAGGVAAVLAPHPLIMLAATAVALAVLLSIDWTMAALVAAAIAIIMVAGLTPAQGGLAGSLAALTFYLLREAGDKQLKLREGEYTEKGRLDRVGDLLGPCTVPVVAALAVLAEWAGHTL